MQLREHQIECINNINKHFENDTKALVKMFCGSGKSYIIYHCLLKYTKDLSVIVVPSINLVSQFIKDYLLKYDNNYKLLSICSKNEVDKHLDFTTDEDDIYDFIINNESKIIIITYQSFELLLNIIKENEFEIDLICFDEAHHIVSHNMKKLLFDYDEDDEDDIYENFIDLYCNKTLFFTATPKNHNSIMMYEPYVTDNFEFIDDDNSCITEEPHCGKMIYEYMHINGVNYNILNDFNIMIDLYTENTDNNIFEAISRSILQTGNNRVLTFHSSVIKTNKGSNVLDFINEELFIKCFNKILNTEFSHLENKYKSIIFNGITANTKNKLKILEQFDNTKDNEIYILASCKTIGEGVDTKNANMVVFIDPKQSYVEIIQNIGRVCRKNENTKQLATILLPIYVDVNKYKECNTEDEQNKVIMDEMSKTGDFTMILNVLTALRQEDPYIFELCINLPNVFTDKEINDTIKKSNLKLKDKEYSNIKLFKSYNLEYNNNLNEIDNFNNLSKSLENNINIVNQVIENTDININNNYDKTINFIKTENNTYKKVKGDNILTRPNRNIKPKYNLNDELKILWKIEGNINLDKKIFCGYINSTIKLSNEEEWLKKLKEVEEYIIKNNKRPKYNDKNNDIKKLGTWLSHQINNYKNNRSIMKNKKYKQLFKKFLNEYKYIFPDNIEIWCNNLEKLKEFINKNYRLPLENNKINGERHLRLWLYKQQKNYYNKIGIMKVQVIYNKWLTFINEYKEYLLNYEVKWYNNFNKLIKFINENNRLPSKNNDEKHLIGWLSSQKYNYKLKKESMSNINIYEEWSKFINEYKGYLLNNEEKWYNNLNKVKKFIDKNTKTPSGISKNRDEQLLGKWLTAQKKNYKSKIHIMKNKYIYDEYTLFTDDYKKYLLDNE
jgi:superfamily II DNA or RNA helicase